MASAGIKVGLTLEGASEYQTQMERAAAKTEEMARRSEKAINSVMNSAQRQFDTLTKSPLERQIEKLQASGATPEQIEKLRTMHAQMDAFRNSQLQKEKEAKAQEMAVAERARAAEVAAAQRAKDKQIAMSRELAAAREQMEARQSRTRNYAATLGSGGPMFGKTLGPLVKGFVGFRAVTTGLSLVTNLLDQLNEKGPAGVKVANALSDTVIGLVNGLPGGELLTKLADQVSRLMGMGSNSEDAERQKRLDEQSAAFQRSMQIQKDAADKAAAEKERKKKVFEDLMHEQYISEQQILGNKTNIYVDQLDILRNQKEINDEQYSQLLAAYEKNKALEDSLKEQADLKERAEKLAQEANQRAEMRAEAEDRHLEDQQSLFDELQDAYNRRYLSEKQLFELKLQDLDLDKERTAKAWEMYDAIHKSSMLSSGGVQSISTAVGSMRIGVGLDQTQAQLSAAVQTARESKRSADALDRMEKSTRVN